MKNNILLLLSLLSGAIIVLILTNGISIGKVINRYFPCEQNLMNSFPCYGKYDLICIGIATTVIFIIALYSLFGYVTHSSKIMPPDMSAVYNTKVKYKLGQKIQFPDFTLELTGTDTRQGPNNATFIMTNYTFLVGCHGEIKKIFWSAGTGDIGPTRFNCKEKKFHLEKARSDTLGQLNTDELVIIKQ